MGSDYLPFSNTRIVYQESHGLYANIFCFLFLRVQEKMQRLGYLRKNTQGVSSVITSDELRQAIRDYQEAFNIPVTGKTG